MKIQCVDWFVKDAFTNGTNPDGTRIRGRSLVLKTFGRTMDGLTVGVNVLGFTPFFYIRCKHEVDTANLETAFSSIKGFDNIAGYELVKMKPFRDWVPEALTYVKVSFTTLTSYKQAVSSIKYGNFCDKRMLANILGTPSLMTADLDITPELRLFHMTGVQPAGWMEFDERNLNPQSRVFQMADDTHCNYDVHWTAIRPVDCSEMAPLKVASFDIECMSPSRSFPRPINSYSNLCEDIVNAWADTCTGNAPMSTTTVLKNIYNSFYRPEESSFRKIIFSMTGKYAKLDMTPFERIFLTYTLLPHKFTKSKLRMTVKGALEDLFATLLCDKKIPAVAGEKVSQIGIAVKCIGGSVVDKHLLCLKSCSPIDGVNVISYGTESELLLGWRDMMQKIDPDVVIGYNTNNFDYMFIIERCTVLGICIQDNDWLYRTLQYSRMAEDSNYNCFSKRLQKIRQSAAFGDSVNDIIYSPGRVNIDLLKVIQQNYQLDSYKLDDVAYKFMSGYVLEIIDSTHIKVSSPDDLDVGNYMKFAGDRKIKVLGIDGDIVTLQDAGSLAVGSSWGMVKDDVSVNEIFESYEGSADDRANIGKYCVQDCVLVIKIIEKLAVITNAIAMANVCYIPLDYVYWRGQNIRAYSLVGMSCAAAGYVIPDLVKDENAIPEVFEGATVLHCTPGVYDDTGVIVLDYASLYPSSIITENISHETLLKTPEDINRATDLGYAINTVSYTTHNEASVSKYFVSETSQKGLLPLTINKLLVQRKVTRKKQKEFPAKSFQWNILEGVQLAYKVVANSMYGTLGASTSKLCYVDLAACVTAVGRSTISLAMSTVQQRWGGRIVYVDTDSTWIVPALVADTTQTKAEMLQECINMGKHISSNIGKYLRGVQDLEYEMVVYPLIMFSKKRYVGTIYENDGGKSEGQKTMGIVLKRRDNAPILKEVFGGIIDTILKATDIGSIGRDIVKMIERLHAGEFPLKHFIITKKLLASYANPEGVAHKVLADRMAERDPGTAPIPNERLAYVIVDPEAVVGKGYCPKKIKMGDRLESVAYLHKIYGGDMTYGKFIELPPPAGARIDYVQYVLSQIEKPVLQTLELMIADDIALNSEVVTKMLERSSNPVSSKVLNAEIKLREVAIDEWKDLKLYETAKKLISRSVLHC